MISYVIIFFREWKRNKISDILTMLEEEEEEIIKTTAYVTPTDDGLQMILTTGRKEMERFNIFIISYFWHSVGCFSAFR